MAEPYFIDCSFCDHADTLSLDRDIYPSEAIRLHERAIAHIRAHHSRARSRKLGVTIEGATTGERIDDEPTVMMWGDD